jgi:hypothetical protein
MTLSISWVRNVANTQELIFATDSRLRAGYAWDCCPKILLLPRSDSAICFAGDTMYTYPMMLQMQAAIGMYPKSRSRAMDLYDMRHHTLEVFNGMRDYIHDLPKGTKEPESPDAFFILGGYSWQKNGFAIWLLHYDSSLKAFTFRPSSPWQGGDGKKVIALAGDYTLEAKERLRQILKSRGKIGIGGFDMEPFEVLRDMLREGEASPKKYPLIGGPPQIVKIYRHMNTVPYAVYWPDKASGKVSVLGRPLLSYEKPTYLLFDPDTFEAKQPI